MKLRMVERHFFRNKLLKSFDFDFGFCIPKSTNTVEHIYEFPALTAAECKCPSVVVILAASPMCDVFHVFQPCRQLNRTKANFLHAYCMLLTT